MTIARLLRISHQRARSLFRKDAIDREVSRELAFHFDQLVEENIAAGMFPSDARLAAQRVLGNTASLEEQCRDQRGVRWVHDLRQDLVYGLRMLARDRAFALVAIVSLALGIGANAATLRVIQRVALEALPYPESNRLVLVRTYGIDTPSQNAQATIPEYLTWKNAIESIESMGASLGDQADFGADADGQPAERLAGQLFDEDVFKTLGVQAAKGRVFTARDFEGSTSERPLIISDRLWRRRFAAAENIVGTRIRLNGATAEIIGVMPPEFAYPIDRSDYWAPLRISAGRPGSAPFYQIVARMKPGVSLEAVQADLGRLSVQVPRDVPSRLETRGVRLQPLREAFYGWVEAPLAILQTGVLLMLLIGCANVVGLLLARGVVRGPEVAMRMALGAGRGRIIRQFFAESVLLSCASGLVALPIAAWGVRMLSALNPLLGAQRVPEVSFDGTLVAAIVALVAMTGVVFGVFPAIGASRPSTDDASVAVRLGSSRYTQRFRGGLVAGQVALAVILLVGTGLLLNSVARLSRRDLNFQPRGLLMFDVRFRPAMYAKPIGTYKDFTYYDIAGAPARALEQMHERLRDVAGVEAVAGVSYPPASSFVIPKVAVAADSNPSDARTTNTPSYTAAYYLVTPGFFTTIKAPLVRGREIDARDTVGAPWTAIVNETLARHLWNGADPVGRVLRLTDAPDDRPREVIGVVRDIPTGLAQKELQPAIYASYLQQPSRFPGPYVGMFGQMTFLMRKSNDEVAVMPGARQAIAEVDPDRPVIDARPMDALLAAALWARHGYILVLSIFAVAATFLAAIGIYGVTIYSVARQTREIGVRLALGASAVDIVALIGRGVTTMIGIGAVIGVVAAVPLTQLISAQLWGVTPTDPATFSAVIVLLLVVALLACWLPVRRALRVDPTIALKCE